MQWSPTSEQSDLSWLFDEGAQHRPSPLLVDDQPQAPDVVAGATLGGHKGAIKAVVSRSSESGKKYKVDLKWTDSDGREHDRTIHFGQAGARDFIKMNASANSDKERAHARSIKEAYIGRHKDKEDWGLSGVPTAGFWSRWILWNQTTLGASISNLRSKFSSLNVTHH